MAKALKCPPVHRKYDLSHIVENRVYRTDGASGRPCQIARAEAVKPSGGNSLFGGINDAHAQIGAPFLGLFRHVLIPMNAVQRW